MRKVDVLDFKGSYYEICLAHCRRLHNSEHFQSMISKIKGMSILNQDTEEIKDILNYFCPQLLDELSGLQEGLKYTESDVF